MNTCTYKWWPIRLMWSNAPLARTLMQQIRYALDSRKWTMTHPHRFSCEEALRVHKAAAKRFWHGWELGRSGGAMVCGWTLHLGRLKVVFGRSQ